MRKPLLALASLCCVAAFSKAPNDARQFLKQIPRDDRVLQALNRLTFGARPGDAERVRALGLKKWIDLQLHPERIPENPVLTEKLKTLDTLTMSSAEMVRNYPTPQMVRRWLRDSCRFPPIPTAAPMIEKLVARAERKQGDQPPAPNAPEAQPLADILTREQIRSLRTGTPQQRIAAFQALPADKQDEVIAALPGGMRQQLFADGAARNCAAKSSWPTARSRWWPAI